MSKARYVLTTVSRLLSARLLYRLFYALSVILVSNYLISDPALLDAFDVASASVSIMMIVSEVGMSMVVMRSGSQHDTKKLERYYGTALVIETVAWTTLFIGVLGVYALSAGFTTMFWLLAILGIGQAIIQYRVVFRSIYRVLYKKEWITFIEVIDGILKLIGIFLITKFIIDPQLGIFAIAGLYTVSTMVFVAIYGLNTFRYIKPKYEPTLLKPMLKEGTWFSMQALVMTVYFEIDKLMLRLFQSNDWADIADGDIGRYTAAARLVVFLLIFHRVGLQVITPYLYANFNKNMKLYRKVTALSTKYLGALGIGMGVGLFMLGDQIIRLIYKPDLWQSIPALQLFGVFVAIRFIGITSSQIFATTNQQPLRTKLEFGSVVFNILLDIVMIPLYGFMGGVIATVITELLLQIVFYVISRKSIAASIWKQLQAILPAILASGIMAASIFVLKPFSPVLLTIPVAMIVYAIALYGLRFVKPREFTMLRKEAS